MKVFLHQTHHSIGDFDSILNYLKYYFAQLSSEESENQNLHLFPELFLCGYPLKDLCLQKAFINNYLAFLERVNEWAQKETKLKNQTLLMGGLNYNFGQGDQIPQKIENVIFELGAKKQLNHLYTKQLLPNYDIFDEKKYFTPGNQAVIYSFSSLKIGLLICEDMWASNLYNLDPCEELFKLSKLNPIDLIINLSASPFYKNKHQERVERAQLIAAQIGCPFVYVNRVGGEDEILFDGRSFITDGDKIKLQGPIFKQEVLSFDINPTSQNNKKNDKYVTTASSTWEHLFKPELDINTRPAKLRSWDANEMAEVLSALVFGLQEYANKNKFERFTVAVSGGIDSALVLFIATLAAKDPSYVEAIYMPGHFSSSLSTELSTKLCQNLQVKLNHLPIKFLHSTIKNQFRDIFKQEMTGMTDENIQSRIRGNLLYARSNQTNSLVINTSNKSELSVGYSTIYGDSVGAISILGDLYKTEIFELCEYINQKYNQVIPKEIINRPPTAELRENQRDDQSLPTYQVLDAILEGILSYRLGGGDLLSLGYEMDTIKRVFKLYHQSEFKRYQFCPIIKIRPKSFGFGHRVPISKSLQVYLDEKL